MTFFYENLLTSLFTTLGDYIVTAINVIYIYIYIMVITYQTIHIRAMPITAKCSKYNCGMGQPWKNGGYANQNF